MQIGGKIDKSNNSIKLVSAQKYSRIYAGTEESIDYTPFEKMVVICKGYCQCMLQTAGDWPVEAPTSPSLRFSPYSDMEVRTAVIDISAYGIGRLWFTVCNGETGEILSIAFI